MGENVSPVLEIKEDDLLALRPSPLRLEMLASNKVATLLWRHKINDLNPWDNLTSWLIDQHSTKYGELLPLPSNIKNMIDGRIKEIIKRTEIWKNYHSRYIFIDRDDEAVMKKCIESVEAGDSDKVIARRLLGSNKLTTAERYRLACRCCFENEIKKLWPLVSKNSRITSVGFLDNEMIYYWNCVMKGVSPNVPATDPDYSIELRMITCRYVFNEIAIEYFWSKLAPEDRMLAVLDVFSKGSENIIMSLLPKLNDVMLRHILEYIAQLIFLALVPHRDNFECVVVLWEYYCKFAPARDLFELLRRIFVLAFEPSLHSTDEGFHVSQVLHELWVRTPDTLQNSFQQTQVFDMFDDLSDVRIDRFRECYHRDVSFLLDLLKGIDLPTRNSLMRKNLHKFVIRVKPFYLKQLLELCFDNDVEMIRFKENEMMDYENNLLEEFKEFVNNGYCDELGDYLNFCSSDKERIQNLRKLIVRPHFEAATLRNSEKLTSLLKFINDNFESTEMASKFKEEMLVSADCNMLESLYDNLERGCLQDMINIRHFLYSESCTSMIKQECANRCKKCLVEVNFVQFNVNVWREFIKWCLGSQEAWWAFRRSLPVDQIFEQLLTKVLSQLCRLTTANEDEIRQCFTPVDNFFLWCYFNKEIVGRYKVGKLKNDSSRVLRVTMSKNWGKIVDIILMWVFDNDTQRLNEYKASLKPKEKTGSA